MYEFSTLILSTQFHIIFPYPVKALNLNIEPGNLKDSFQPLSFIEFLLKLFH